MARKESNPSYRVEWTFEFEKERCSWYEYFEVYCSARLPEIDILRIDLAQVPKPIVICYTQVELHSLEITAFSLSTKNRALTGREQGQKAINNLFKKGENWYRGYLRNDNFKELFSTDYVP
jgi:hypothetical protein